MATTAKYLKFIHIRGQYGEYSIKQPVKKNKLPVRLGRFIGSGAFSFVFHSLTHKDRVFKVYHLDSDPAYTAFLTDLLANQSWLQGNPHLPIIYSAICYIYDDAQIVVVELERLYDLDRHLKPEEFKKWINIFRIDLMKENWKKHWALWNPEFHAAMAFLLNLFMKYGEELKLQFDIHSGNLMVRKDGSIVVIDPLALLTW